MTLVDAQEASARAAETAARASYGRLISWLAYQWRDLAAAEDALAEAFHSALTHWPVQGVPASPDAWLMAAAKNNLLHAARQRRLHDDPAVTILLAMDEGAEDVNTRNRFPDERLKLLFVCAHPAIDEKMRTALMLQCVLGFDAAAIASAFLLSPATMAQRLVRAKNKIRDSGIRFEEPDPAEMPARLANVLEAIYAAYGAGWENVDGADAARREFVDEALYLAELLARLLPAEPEAQGLQALLLFCESRRDARLNDAREFVPLLEQDIRLWNRALHDRAEAILARAAAMGKPGHFQIEAAIQSAHMQRLRGGETPWRAIVAMYDWLQKMSPSLGASVSRAVAMERAFDLQHALAAMAEIDEREVAAYQPYWAAQAHLQAAAGNIEAAHAAYARAIGLAESAIVKAHLLKCKMRL